MKMKRLKGEKEILAALNTGFDWPPNFVEVLVLDGTVKGVRIGKVHLGIDSYNFVVSEEVEFDTQSMYRVVAKATGFEDQVRYFPDYKAASQHRQSFDALADVTGPDEVDCLVNAAGEVVREVNEGADPKAGDDLPF